MASDATDAIFAHTPWDGSHPLFRIGVEPLGDAPWIEIDARLDDYLAQKDLLLHERHATVFAAEADTGPAQRETLDMLVQHLLERHGATHRRCGNEVTAGSHGVALDDPAMAPLEMAARLVQEDLVIMMPGKTGWRLAAGCVCFPSSWSLADKFARPLHEVHAPVPGFGTGTRNAALIDRIFDNLKPELPVQRFNWSVYPDDELFHGDPEGEAGDHAPANACLRVERQTLRKLPQTGAVLFTIRIHLDPFERLAGHRNRSRLANGFAASLRQLDDDECRYKGLVDKRAALIDRLEAIAQSRKDDAGGNQERQA